MQKKDLMAKIAVKWKENFENVGYADLLEDVETFFDKTDESKSTYYQIGLVGTYKMRFAIDARMIFESEEMEIFLIKEKTSQKYYIYFADEDYQDEWEPNAVIERLMAGA